MEGEKRRKLTKIVSRHSFLADLEEEVTAVIPFLPLQQLVLLDLLFGLLTRGQDGAALTGGGDGGAGKFDADGALASLGVV